MRRFTCGLLTAALTVGLLAAPASAAEFSDVEGHWGQAAIEQAVEWGLFAGNDQGEFLPDATMTRGMFVTVLERAAKLLQVYEAPVDAAPFDDVAETDYYAEGAAWARETGLVLGVGNNLLAPNDEITREQMCVMMARFLEKCAGMDLSSYEQTEYAFLDQDQISDFAVESVAVCAALGLIQGVPVEGGVEFQPLVSTDRASAAAVFGRMVDAAPQEPQVPEVPDQPGETEEPDQPGGDGGGGQITPPPETEDPQEPTEEEKADEATVAQYLQAMLNNYRNSTYLPTTEQPVKDCLGILMGAVSDALNQRQNGQFLDRAFVQETYAEEISQFLTAYGNLTENQISQIQNAVARLVEFDTDRLNFIMNYFGASMEF